MVWPTGKTHENWNTSDDIMKNGGFFGRHEDTYSDELLHELGHGVIDWIKREGNIFLKYYFADKGIIWTRVNKLEARAPFFKEYLDVARSIQESKLVSEPYDKTKEKDGAHARFILARHHKGDWEDKGIVVADDQQKAKLDATMDFVDFLQKQSTKENIE